MADSSEKNVGGTLYDRRARKNMEPKGAKGHAPIRNGGRGHNSQWYEDNYRLSRDTGSDGTTKTHWTNQNVSRGSATRHRPPSDAR